MQQNLIITIVLLFSTLCTAQVSNVSICNAGEPIQLETLRGAFAYSWSPISSLDNPTIFNPTARPNEPTTYIVQIIPAVASENLVENADFSLGNIGFSSDYPFVNAISQQGVYGVSTSANNLNATYFEDCPDHTDGTGNMMVIDGSPVENEQVWCQTIAIVPNKSYAFSSWLTSVNPQNPAMLRFSINDRALGNIFTAANNVCEWRQFYAIWESGDNSKAQICIINQNTNPAGNDFAMDDFAFYELDSIIYDTFSVEIESLIAARERRVFIPNVFSPNEDGFNDHFEIFVGKGVESIIEFSVFDQWGNKAFDERNCTTNNPCRWDGFISNTKALPGNYIYKALIQFSDGVEEVFSGTFLLAR